MAQVPRHHLAAQVALDPLHVQQQQLLEQQTLSTSSVSSVAAASRQSVEIGHASTAHRMCCFFSHCGEDKETLVLPFRQQILEREVALQVEPCSWDDIATKFQYDADVEVDHFARNTLIQQAILAVTLALRQAQDASQRAGAGVDAGASVASSSQARDANLLLRRAQMLFKAGKLQEAAADAQRSCQLEQSAGAHLIMAEWCSYCCNPSAAIECLNQAKQLCRPDQLAEIEDQIAGCNMDLNDAELEQHPQHLGQGGAETQCSSVSDHNDAYVLLDQNCSVLFVGYAFVLGIVVCRWILRVAWIDCLFLQTSPFIRGLIVLSFALVRRTTHECCLL